jgi:hypothetical protein
VLSHLPIEALIGTFIALLIVYTSEKWQTRELNKSMRVENIKKVASSVLKAQVLLYRLLALVESTKVTDNFVLRGMIYHHLDTCSQDIDDCICSLHMNQTLLAHSKSDLQEWVENYHIPSLGGEYSNSGYIRRNN